MENSDDQDETMTSAASQPEAMASTVPDADAADPIQRREHKKKYYKQHFLALLERCETIQQVYTTIIIL